MAKLFTRTSVAGANLPGANLKATLTALWDALSTIGVADSSRTTVTASATLLTTQCGILLVDCSAGSVTLTLPTSGTSADDAEYRIRRIDSTYANTLTVQRGGADNVEGAATAVVVGAGGQVDLKLPGGSSNWRVVGRGGGTSLAARDALNVPAVNWLDNPDGAVYQRVVAATADDVYMDDRWYALTQTGTITPSQLSNPENGYRFALRITQSQVTAQRMGRAQIVEGKDAIAQRGKTVTYGGRLRLSTGANVRMALLAWTGTEDVVTSDVVNDWTSGAYTTGNFFASANLSLIGTSSTALTAATAGDASVSGLVPAGATNLIVLYWTEAVAAQNVTLDAWGMRLIESAYLNDYTRRRYAEEVERCQRRYEACGVTFRQCSGPTASLLYDVTYSYKVTKASSPTLTQSGSITSSNVGAESVSVHGSAPLEAFRYEVTTTSANTDSFVFGRVVVAACDL